jgi:hypothetical protein
MTDCGELEVISSAESLRMKQYKQLQQGVANRAHI